MKTYLLLTEKAWHDELFDVLKSSVSGNWIRCSNKNSFTINFLKDLSPDFIFIPHWSHIIPKEIYSKYRCVVFHMTDLPYGRGGSPLQNLIMRGHKQTKISALLVDEGLDSGPILLKKDLSLDGSANEIFQRSSEIIRQMIVEIVETNPKPIPQEGEPTFFTRRKPHESNISELQSIVQVYDYIRMLDAAGYPKAFMENDYFRLEFSNAQQADKNTITANVRIIPK